MGGQDSSDVSQAPSQKYGCPELSEDQKVARSFRELWRKATDDNPLTLFGFRRFQTSHLLNLRYLEEEIEKLDHEVYQAGIKLGHTPTSIDKLGLRHAKRDANALTVADVMTRENVLRLRELLKEYGRRE